MSKALLNFASDYVNVNPIDNLWYNLHDKVLDVLNTLCLRLSVEIPNSCGLYKMTVTSSI